jgi:hypothetical protein
LRRKGVSPRARKSQMYEIRRQVAMGEWVASGTSAGFAALRFGVAGARRPGGRERDTSRRSDSRPSFARPLAHRKMCFRPFGRGRIPRLHQATARRMSSDTGPRHARNPACRSAGHRIGVAGASCPGRQERATSREAIPPFGRRISRPPAAGLLPRALAFVPSTGEGFPGYTRPRHAA